MIQRRMRTVENVLVVLAASVAVAGVMCLLEVHPMCDKIFVTLAAAILPFAGWWLGLSDAVQMSRQETPKPQEEA